MNNRGYSLVEILGASAISIVVSFALISFYKNFAEAQQRLLTAGDAKSESKSLMDIFKKSFKARYTPTSNPPQLAAIEWAPLALPTAAFGGCGAAPQPCQNITIRQTNTRLNTVQKITFTTTCEDFPDGVTSLAYSSLPAMPGNFTCPTNFQRPVTTVSTMPDEANNLVGPPSSIRFPRGNIYGTFLCARPCGNDVAVEIDTIYRASGARNAIFSERAILSTQDQVRGVEILPP